MPTRTAARRKRTGLGWGLLHRELGLLGIYIDHAGDIDPPFGGYRIAVYGTREQARRFLRGAQQVSGERDRTDGWRYWLITKVVRVAVTVEIVD